MRRRSTTILLAGVLTLLLGTALAFAALRSGAATASPTGPTTPTRARSGAPAGQPPGGLRIPADRQAIAVALDPVAGTAGVATVGARINVFAAVTRKDRNGEVTNAARLLLQGIEVLRVDSGPATGGPAPGRDAAPAPVTGASTAATFVLAVNAAQAEKLVFHGAFSRLWFSVVPGGQPPVATPGVDTGSQLQPEAR